MAKETKQEAWKIMRDMIFLALGLALSVAAVAYWIGPEKAFPGSNLNNSEVSSEKYNE